MRGWILLIFIGLWITGCYSNNELLSNLETTETEVNSRISLENNTIPVITQDGLSFGMVMEREGDNILITASITNKREDKIEYYAGSSSCISRFTIDVFSHNSKLLKPFEEPQLCTDDIYTEYLEPGQTIEETEIFIVSAFNGEYEGKINFSPVDREWGNPIIVSFPIINLDSSN